MKIAIFLPMLSQSVGGAEVYALNLASVLADENDITFLTLASDQPDFDINAVYDLQGVRHYDTRLLAYEKSPSQAMDLVRYYGLWRRMASLLKKDGFDLFINASEGRLRGIPGIRSIHIIHFPEKSYSMKYGSLIGGFFDKRYVTSYQTFAPNSAFTAYWLQQYWGVQGQILYPPIDMEPIPARELAQKENVILTVARLVPDKKILEMMEFFREMGDETGGWRLVVLGNPDRNQPEYDEKLQALARSESRIEIHSHITHDELVSWYRRAKIYWHAKGYGVTEDGDPHDMEHFGMTTVEAMANGCIPVVIDRAGQKEIVEDATQGFKWETPEQLKEYTLALIRDEEKIKEMQPVVIRRSENFLMPAFTERLRELIR